MIRADPGWKHNISRFPQRSLPTSPAPPVRYLPRNKQYSMTCCPSSNGNYRPLNPLCCSRSNATNLLMAVCVAAILANACFPRLLVQIPASPTTALQRLTGSPSESNSRTMAINLATPHCPIPYSKEITADRTTTGPMFVFVVGLEGTGHHLHEVLVEGSPNYAALAELGLLESVRAVSELLFGSLGLMSLHCIEHDPRLQPYAANATARCARFDMACLHRELVGEFRHIRSAVVAAETPLRTIHVNANALLWYSMASYPSYMHRCRFLEYPVLDFFYDACDKAGVDCRHVYIYRDPLEVIMSTTHRRRFNKGPLIAMQLYTTMLKVMRSQFLDRPQHTVGCLGLYEGNSTSSEEWETLRRLLGYSTAAEFQQSMKAVYVPPQPMSDVARASLVPPQSQLHFAPYLQAFNTMLQLCREQVAANACPTESY